MNTRFARILVLLLILTACAPLGTTPTPAVRSSNVAELQELLPQPPVFIAPPPITSVPTSQITIEGVPYIAYHAEGDTFQIVCQEPCQFDERFLLAIYAGFKVRKEQLVRAAGIDILPANAPVDIHLVADSICSHPGEMTGGSSMYDQGRGRAFICLYLDDLEAYARYDPLNPPTPETALRVGGYGVIGHEYAHVLFFNRYTDSFEDYVQALDYHTTEEKLRPGTTDLCNERTTRDYAPILYQMCQQNGLDFETFTQSLIDVDRLYQAGYGAYMSVVTTNQYRAILTALLGSDPVQAFLDGGYAFGDLSPATPPYRLPWEGEPCSDRARLVGDVTIPEGTTLDVGSGFDKTWQVLNAGTCTWKQGYSLVFFSGEAMSDRTVVPLPAAAPGESIQVSVPMTAPGVPGVHTGQWRLRNADGELFGPIINITLYVRPGCTQPPQMSSFSASPGEIAPGSLALLSWGAVDNADRVEITPDIGPVAAYGGRALVSPGRTTTYTLTAYCGNQTASQQVVVSVDPSAQPFAVTGLQTSTNLSSLSTTCDPEGSLLKFFADITVTGPSVVITQWSRSDFGIEPPVVRVFHTAGTHTVEGYWGMYGPLSGWMQLELIAPVEMLSDQAGFTFTCTP